MTLEKLDDSASLLTEDRNVWYKGTRVPVGGYERDREWESERRDGVTGVLLSPTSCERVGVGEEIVHPVGGCERVRVGEESVSHWVVKDGVKIQISVRWSREIGETIYIFYI